MLVAAAFTFSANAAEPTFFGNLNVGIANQKNMSEYNNDTFVNTNYSYLGITDKRRINSMPGFNSGRYMVEVAANFEDEDNPIKLRRAFVELGSEYLSMTVGKTLSVQQEALMNPLDVFKSSRMLAMEDGLYMTETTTKDTIKLRTKVNDYYLTGSMSFSNEDDYNPVEIDVGDGFMVDDGSTENTKTIKSYAIALGGRNESVKYAISHWMKTANDGKENSFWGINLGYTTKMFGINGTYIIPESNNQKKMMDVAFVSKFTENVNLKAKYSTVDEHWKSFGVGFESNINRDTATYIEFQRKAYKSDMIDSESLLAVGVNYKF